MTRRTNILAVAVLALLVGAVPALAQQAIDESRQVDKDATISIENIAGSVTVTGWNKSEVQITGTLDDKAEELEITGGGSKLTIEVKYPDDTENIDEGSALVLMVPHGADVEVSVVSADVEIDEVRGEVEIEAVSGEIVLRGEPAEIEVATVSGNLDLDVATDVAALACVSGDIEIKGVRRELECAVVSGNITVDAGKDMESLECETVSGDITVTGSIARGAEWQVSAHSGDITLKLIGKVNAEFDVETFSGEIHDMFGHSAERTSKYAPGSELSFTEGDGDANVEIEAFSGDVKVRVK